MSIRRLRLFIVVCGVVAALPAVATSASRKPDWCSEGSNRAKCYNAEFDFSNKLGDRWGNAWKKAKPKLEACPWAAGFQDTVPCMAYFAYHGEFRFSEGSVSRSQDARDTATISHTTSWKRTWRKCSLDGMSKQARLGLEEQRAVQCPSHAGVLQRLRLDEWLRGLPRYSPTIYWQFTESGLFAAAGMKPVAIAHCGYKNKIITCSDSKGDSFKYIY